MSEEPSRAARRITSSAIDGDPEDPYTVVAVTLALKAALDGIAKQFAGAVRGEVSAEVQNEALRRIVARAGAPHTVITGLRKSLVLLLVIEEAAREENER